MPTETAPAIQLTTVQRLCARIPSSPEITTAMRRLYDAAAEVENGAVSSDGICLTAWTQACQDAGVVRISNLLLVVPGCLWLAVAQQSLDPNVIRQKVQNGE